MCSNKVSSCVQESIWYVWGNMRWFKSLKITEVKITEVMKSPGPSKKKKVIFEAQSQIMTKAFPGGPYGESCPAHTHLGGSPWGELSQDLGPPGQPLSLTSLHSSWGALIPPRSLYLRPWADLFRHPIQEEEGNPVLFHSEPFPIPRPQHLRVLLGLLFWAHSTASCWPKPMLTHLTPAPLQEGEWKEGSQCFLQCKLLFIPLREVMKG